MSRPELASWMASVGYDILRRLENEENAELVLTLRTIPANTNWSRSGVDGHLRTLRDHGLVAPLRLLDFQSSSEVFRMRGVLVIIREVEVLAVVLGEVIIPLKLW